MAVYKIIFKGEITDESKMKSIGRGLAKFLKIPEDKAHLLFSGKTIAIKKGLSEEAANMLHAKLLKAGVITYVKSEKATTPASKPKVHHEQQPKPAPQRSPEKSQGSKESLSTTWQERFDVLERHEKGGVKLTFKDNQAININLVALIFGPFYYFAKGMWIKGGFLLSALFVFYGLISLGAESGGKVTTGILVGPYFLIMILANRDYYRHVKCGDKVWRWMPKWFKSPFAVVPTVLSSCLLWFLLSYNFDAFTLDDMSGVWLAESDSAMIAIDLISDNKSISINGKPFAIRQVAVDSYDSSIVSIEVEWTQGQLPIWTLSKLEDEDGSFYLDLTLHNGVQDELSFVRGLAFQ